MRILLMTLLFSGVWNSGHAQIEFKPYSEYSLKAGSGMSKMFITGATGDSPFIGSTFGGRFIYFGEKILAVMVEVNYSSLKGNEPDVSDLSYSYIHTPFMTRISIPLGRSAISVNLGSYVQFPLRSDPEIVMDRSALLGLAGGLEFSFPVAGSGLTPALTAGIITICILTALL